MRAVHPVVDGARQHPWPQEDGEECENEAPDAAAQRRVERRRDARSPVRRMQHDPREHHQLAVERPQRRPLPRPARILPIVVPQTDDHEPPPAVEPRIIEILTSMAQPGETIESAYRRKERELAALFSGLPKDNAVALHRRLAEPRDDDPLAKPFARLVRERRLRLLAIIARRR